ncbi:MAG: tetratricopeptide repeat protein [Flavobacteriaceae bacterium]
MKTKHTLESATQLLQLGQISLAETAFRNITEQEPQMALAWCQLANCLLQQNNVPEALNIAKNGLVANPNNTDILSFLSMLHWNLNQPEEAIDYGEKASAETDSQALIPYNLGNMYYTLNRKQEAIGAFNKAIEADPKLVSAHINLGIVLSEEALYDQALDHLNIAITLNPNNPQTYSQTGMVHHVKGNLEDAKKHYHTAEGLITDPKAKVEIFVLMGNVLRDLQEPKEALEYYQKVLEIDPNNAVALQNSQTLSSRKIPKWHFDMLADTDRNDAYNEAIISTISPQDTVLDIGTGSGLLALMAARAGASHVCAVEMVSDLAEVASEIVDVNNYQDIISIHHEKSTNLKIGNQLDHKATFVVSEILDAGLLGEGVIPSLRHAWKNLLEPDAKCVPKGADLYGILIETKDYHKVSPVKEVSGFDLTPFNKFSDSDGYVTKHLDHLPHKVMSAVFPIIEVDFYNLPPSVSFDNPIITPLKVIVEKDGTVHGVAFWFNLHLTDQVSMSSAPDGEMVHWGQAVFIFPEAKTVASGDVLQINVIQTDTEIKFEFNSD